MTMKSELFNNLKNSITYNLMNKFKRDNKRCLYNFCVYFNFQNQCFKLLYYTNILILYICLIKVAYTRKQTSSIHALKI